MNASAFQGSHPPALARQAGEWWRTAIVASGFQEAYPAYTRVLARLEPVIDPAVSVMAVSMADARVRLHVNLAFFQAHPQFLRGVLQHEIHHIVLGHLTDIDLREAALPDLMALAMETSANDYICEPLPGEPVRWQDFEALGLRAGQSTLERYEILAAARRAGRLSAVSLAWIDDHGGLGRASARGDAGLAGREEVEAMLLAAQANGAKAHRGEVRIAGRVPGDLLQTIRRLSTASPPIDWRAELARFCGRLRVRTRSYARPNRRCPARMGEVPGLVRRAAAPVVLAAIDTSGSMDDETLARVAEQVEYLRATNAVVVAECDAAIQRVYRCKAGIDAVKGRGGTDLRPVFERGFLARHQVDAVVYFTDGAGPYPPENPGVPTLWVLTAGGRFDCPWGVKLRLGAATGARFCCRQPRPCQYVSFDFDQGRA